MRQGAIKTKLTAIDGKRTVKIAILPVVVVRHSTEVRRVHQIGPINNAEVVLINAGPGAVPRKRPSTSEGHPARRYRIVRAQKMRGLRLERLGPHDEMTLSLEKAV